MNDVATEVMYNLGNYLQFVFSLFDRRDSDKPKPEKINISPHCGYFVYEHCVIIKHFRF